MIANIEFFKETTLGEIAQLEECLNNEGYSIRKKVSDYGQFVIEVNK